MKARRGPLSGPARRSARLDTPWGVRAMVAPLSPGATTRRPVVLVEGPALAVGPARRSEPAAGRMHRTSEVRREVSRSLVVPATNTVTLRGPEVADFFPPGSLEVRYIILWRGILPEPRCPATNADSFRRRAVLAGPRASDPCTGAGTRADANQCLDAPDG